MATTKERELRIPDTVPADLVAVPKPAQVRAGRVWGVLRLALGWTFLWAFLDKMLALGFATGRDPETGAIAFFGPAAWINGASPTEGYLTFATKGPFAEFFQGLAGSAWLDWVYMLSMVAIGLALMAGIGVRLAALGGALWMGMFYVSGAIWPENNPFMDNHIIYAIALVGIAVVGAGRYWGLGGWWERTELVRRFPILK